MKYITPNAGATHSGGSRPRVYNKAKEAAIERRKSQYIELICGHLTTWEEDQIYATWRPRANAYYCEKCGKWVDKFKPPKVAIPDQPMF